MEEIKTLLLISAISASSACYSEINHSPLSFNTVTTELSTTKANNASTLRLGVVNNAKSALCVMTKVANAIAIQMDTKIELVPVPPKRLPGFLTKGLLHGDFSRATGYLETVPSALIVQPPIAKIPMFAYGLKHNENADISWNSLKHYNIVMTRGHSLLNSRLKNHNTHVVDSAKSAFGFIRAQRADITILDIISASIIIKRFKPQYDNIQKIGHPLSHIEFNTYISPRYPELVTPYSKAVSQVVNSTNYPKLLSQEGCKTK